MAEIAYCDADEQIKRANALGAVIVQPLAMKEEATQFEYFAIAQDLRLPVETVAAIMQKQKGWGSHGITFHPPQRSGKPPR